MAGAWELPQNEVLVVILTRETVATAWAQAYRHIQLPQETPPPVFLSGMPFDHARNRGVELALEHGYKRLWFIDDDVIVPSDAYWKLAADNLDIVSGLYWRRNLPIAPVAMKLTPQGNQWITQWTGEVFECDLVGAGCLLVKTDVFRRMPAPWFEWWSDKKDKPLKLSEDFSWCWKAKNQHGYKLFVDTRVQCQHAGLGKSGPGGTYDPLTV